MIRDLQVSRRHARITRADDRYVVEDLGSGNGTYVNDRRVQRQILSHQDIIRISSAAFQFEETEAATRIEALPKADPATSASVHIVNRLDANRPMLAQEASQLTSLTSPQELRRMSERLKTIYGISEAISAILDLDQLLPELMSRVFAAFPKSTRAFLMLQDEQGGLVPKAIQQREATDRADVVVPRTVQQEVLGRRNAILSHDAMEDQRFKAGRTVANFGIRGIMAASLIWRNEVLGLIYLDSSRIADFTQDDLQLLTGIAGQASLAVGNARLHQELLRRQRLEQDLHLAQRIQQSFLPSKLPTIPGFTFSAHYEPAYEVGGDFYDFISLPEDRLGIVVGDVSGKGISAALYMARLTRDLRYFASAGGDPGLVLSAANRAVAESAQDDLFVTIVYLVLDPAKRQVQFVNAGHMPPLVRRREEGVVEILSETGGLPVGILPETEYVTQTYDLRPGDTFLLYTDGLVEAMNPAHQMFGEAQLLASMKRGSSGLPHLLRRTIDDCLEHVRDAPQFDDTTVVCFGLDDETRDTEAIEPDDSAPRPGGRLRRNRPR